MNSRLLREFERQLTDWRDSLLQQSRNTIVMERAEATSSLKDAADLAGKEMHRNFTLRIRDRERKLILKIDQALERVKEGSFGICESCGEPIEIRRLRARPVATLCISCKTEQERLERD